MNWFMRTGLRAALNTTTILGGAIVMVGFPLLNGPMPAASPSFDRSIFAPPLATTSA